LAIFVATIVGIIIKPLPMGAIALLGIAAMLSLHHPTLDLFKRLLILRQAERQMVQRNLVTLSSSFSAAKPRLMTA